MQNIDKNHKRRISVTFWMLDEMLCLFEQWTTKNEFNSALYHEMNTLSDEQCASINTDIASMRHVLNQIDQDLQLSHHHLVVGRAIRNMSTLFITDNLTSLNKKSLDAYGKVSEELLNYLEPKVKELIERLEHISELGDASLQNPENE